MEAFKKEPISANFVQSKKDQTLFFAKGTYLPSVADLIRLSSYILNLLLVSLQNIFQDHTTISMGGGGGGSNPYDQQQEQDRSSLLTKKGEGERGVSGLYQKVCTSSNCQQNFVHLLYC
jgi:hypothetical protein